MSVPHLILTAVEHDLADAFHKHCGDLPFITVHEGSIFDTVADALVSPANSYGFMDGGIDALYTHRFGHSLGDRLQHLIRTRHHGELLIGAAEAIETHNPFHPFLIAAPTMRVPMVLRESVNPYLAARAVLLLHQHGTFAPAELLDSPFAGQPVREAIRTIAFPGLGTGIGCVGPHTCAAQIRAAIDDVLLGTRPFPQTWAHASELHQTLYTSRPRNLQHD